MCEKYDYDGYLRCCKIIVTYFGERLNRCNSPTNALETMETLKCHIEYEKNVNPGDGVIMDTIIINNMCNDGDKNIKNYLNSINNTKNKTGKIIVHNRHNIGGSFGGFSYAHDLYKDDYEYWLFCEDDVIIFMDNYYINCIDKLNNSNIGFISLSPIASGKGKLYALGGFGITSKDVMDNTIPKNTSIKFSENMDEGEEIFSKQFGKIEYSIYSPFCINYGEVNNHKKVKKNNTDIVDNKNYIYYVGKMTKKWKQHIQKYKNERLIDDTII